ncbi:hypothetical protein [Sinanaerobacter sp. ZZT-01]|uniref:IMCp domain-containing protein n=1 Tax=Sinanaerobacter sp. ZZT-01 TaxID=3111540 RepID=UPI002D770B0A|nr:hypothetical protein [Sinanaerobacter sp. ZZT-01]WRR93380.1 hypothetical protein U5921_15325 [Sinanaerobacter sp. ZZT-01]
MAKKSEATALAMLGSLENVRQLIPVFNQYGINLIDKDYVLIEEIIEGIQTERADIVLISDAALVGTEDGKREVIKAIREVDKEIFISLFINYEKPDEQFKNWAFGYGVYNLYYAIDGNYNFTEIMPEIKNRSMPVSNKSVKVVEKIVEKVGEVEKPIEKIIEKPIEKIVEKEVPIEVIKEVPIEVEKEVIKEVPVEVEKIVEKIVEKKIMVPTDAKLMGKITLGIFNLARGAGATTTAISLAENLQSLGYDTAVISMDDKIDLHYLDKKKNAAYIIPAPGEKRLKLLEAYKNDYKFILLDFGNLFDILPTGQLKTDRLTEKEYEIEEFFRCNYKIAVGFSDEWNAGKLNYFINNPAFDNLETFIFSIRGLTDRIAKQYNLNFCSSTDTALEILLMWLGIEQNRERLKGKDRKAAFSFLFN